MYLCTELQKIAFLLRMSVGKIGHLILRDREKGSSNDFSVIATTCHCCEEHHISLLGKILFSGMAQV